MKDTLTSLGARAHIQTYKLINYYGNELGYDLKLEAKKRYMDLFQNYGKEELNRRWEKILESYRFGENALQFLQQLGLPENTAVGSLFKLNSFTRLSAAKVELVLAKLVKDRNSALSLPFGWKFNGE